MANKASAAAIIISIVSLCTAGVSVGFALHANSTAQTPEEPALTTAAPESDTMQYVMYVGTNDKDTYQPEHTKKEAMQIVDEICLKYFDGYTLQEATGSWMDEKNNITHEYTIVCYFDDAKKEDVYHAADDIIAALNQNTVLIEENKIRMEYYTSSEPSAANTAPAVNTAETAPLRIKDNAQISYLGPAGTYTEEAAQLFFGENAQLFPQKNVDDSIAELTAGRTDYAVIPQENTIGGAVTNYVDALIAQSGVYVVGEIVLPISQTLMALPGTKLTDIKTVYSHAQGLSQSKEWLGKNLPDVKTVEKNSTAEAASYVAETGDHTLAAIAAPGAAALYGLEKLAENVQITSGNRTRFYVLSREQSGAAHSNAVFVAECSADLIDDIIVDIHEAGLEMTALHDRPEGTALGTYKYIIEVQNATGITQQQIKEASANPAVRFLGCFDVTQK